MLLEAHVDGAVIVDAAGKVLFANRAARRLFGREDLEGDRLHFPATPGTSGADLLVARPDGSHRAVELRSGPVSYLGGEATLLALRDVTERSEAEDENRFRVFGERLDVISRLATGVAGAVHEPLDQIQHTLARMDSLLVHLEAAFRVMPEGEDRSESSLLRELGNMVRAGEESLARIRGLVRHLRTFTPIDREKVQLVDVNEVASAAIEQVGDRVRPRADVRVELGLVPPILGHRGRLCQAVACLLVNAAQAIPRGLPDSNEIRLSTAHIERTVVLRVQDTGRGMTDDELSQIFEPFYSTMAGDDHAGLGLSICADILRQHGGDIEVTTEVGIGTCIALVLPEDTGLTPTTGKILSAEAD